MRRVACQRWRCERARRRWRCRRSGKRKGNVGGWPFRRRNGWQRFWSGRCFPQRRNDAGPWIRISRDRPGRRVLLRTRQRVAPRTAGGARDARAWPRRRPARQQQGSNGEPGAVERDTDRDDARHSQDSSKEQRDTSKDRAQQHGRKDKDQTVGNKSERDNTQRSEDRTQDRSKADTKADSRSNSQQSGSGTQGAFNRNSNSGTNQNAAQG